MNRTLEDVLQDAREQLVKHDALRLQMRLTEDNIRRLCREYDAAVGCRGIRPESLRFAVEMRTGKKVEAV